MLFRQITVCLDMRGCPNRCRHCWLGVTPNGHLEEPDLRFVAQAFRPFTRDLEVMDWYREPDYGDDYQKMWELTGALSDRKTPHFENLSIWRAVRDSNYIPWLRSLGVRSAQLTLFGGEETTDLFFGRKGVYREILETIDRLLENGIAPRIQTFIYKQNIGELPHIEKLIDELDLENRCSACGREFAFFLHQGSCDGENEQFYDDWITPEDIRAIPPGLARRTLRHYGRASLEEVLGKPEGELVEELLLDHTTENLVTDTPVFYVDRQFDVYPNYETPSESYRLGNLKTDGVRAVLMNYAGNRTLAQHTRLTVPISEMARACGNPDSRRLFGKWDYQNMLHNRYCRVLSGRG